VTSEDCTTKDVALHPRPPEIRRFFRTHITPFTDLSLVMLFPPTMVV